MAKMVGDEPNLRTYYYHTDHLGSIRAVSNSNGNIVGLYTYDPFGNVIQEVSYPDADRLRFTGKNWIQQAFTISMQGTMIQLSGVLSQLILQGKG